MSNAHGGVFDIFRLLRLTPFSSAILLTPFDFPPSCTRTRGRRGNKEGEVSDPPFSVPTLARNGPPFDTPFDICVTGGRVAHFSVTTLLIPAGRLKMTPGTGKMGRMEDQHGNLKRVAKPAAEVLRRRRSWCCPHCGYQGNRSLCPRCDHPCEPLPSKRRKP